MKPLREGSVPTDEVQIPTAILPWPATRSTLASRAALGGQAFEGPAVTDERILESRVVEHRVHFLSEP